MQHFFDLLMSPVQVPVRVYAGLAVLLLQFMFIVCLFVSGLGSRFFLRLFLGPQQNLLIRDGDRK